MHVEIGDKIYVTDMTGEYKIISISPVNTHIMDLILEQNGIKYFVKRRKFQLKKVSEYKDTHDWLRYL